MHITLFGGSFNPPHLGHLIVTQQALELVPQIDELWILPCYRHTFLKDLAPTKHRLQMSELLIDAFPAFIRQRTKICPIEIDFKLSGETYDALQKLHTETDYLEKTMHPPKPYTLVPITYSFLMGSDQLSSFTKWGNWEQLLTQMHFFIYPRSNYRNDIPYQNMSLLESPTQVVTNLSSTLIRKRINKHLSLDHLVTRPIAAYISTHNLYQ